MILRDILEVPVSLVDGGTLRYVDGEILLPQELFNSTSMTKLVTLAIEALQPNPEHEIKIYKNLVLAKAHPIFDL